MNAMPSQMEELIDFVSGIAEMNKDGELADGDEFILENDDAYETVMSLISMARAILGQPEDRERYED